MSTLLLWAVAVHLRRGCFDDWWCWQQQAYMEQQRTLEARTGATAAAALVQVGPVISAVSSGQSVFSTNACS
jgi:hypothetical protein